MISVIRFVDTNSPRDFLNAHQSEIKYIEVDDANILADLDTPEDYARWQP